MMRRARESGYRLMMRIAPPTGRCRPGRRGRRGVTGPAYARDESHDIRLIAAGRFTDAYMVNGPIERVFSGILGRTCDRPAGRPAARSRREDSVERCGKPVAICRLKRVAADLEGTFADRLPPRRQRTASGSRLRRRQAGVADRGERPGAARLRVTVFDGDAKAGRPHALADPALPLPESVIDEETGCDARARASSPLRLARQSIDSMRELLIARLSTRSSSAAARRAGTSNIPGRRRRRRTSTSASTGSPRSRSATSSSVGKRVIVLGGGNTAMDCCRSARRLGGEDVKVDRAQRLRRDEGRRGRRRTRSTRASRSINMHVPKFFLHEARQAHRHEFEKVASRVRRRKGRRQPRAHRRARRGSECDDVLVAIGQENAFPWIERDPAASSSTVGRAGARRGHDLPVDAAAGLLRRRRGVRAEEHHHRGRPRPRRRGVDRPLLPRRGRTVRPAPHVNLMSQKMGIHEWSYDNAVSQRRALRCRGRRPRRRWRASRSRSNSASTPRPPSRRRERCLNCDVQTVFTAPLCIECDACTDICPMDCITSSPTARRPTCARA